MLINFENMKIEATSAHCAFTYRILATKCSIAGCTVDWARKAGRLVASQCTNEADSNHCTDTRCVHSRKLERKIDLFQHTVESLNGTGIAYEGYKERRTAIYPPQASSNVDSIP